jgi:hypothetical protein
VEDEVEEEVEVEDRDGDGDEEEQARQTDEEGRVGTRTMRRRRLVRVSLPLVRRVSTCEVPRASLLRRQLIDAR